MSVSEILLLLNVLMLVPLAFMTIVLTHMLKTLNQLERRLSRLEGMNQ